MALYRSFMFVPGNQQRRLDKVKELTSDVIIYDLEDSVPLEEKDEARKMVQQIISNNQNRINFVRVNDISTPYFLEDLNTVISLNVHGIVLPKADKKEHVQQVDYLLTKLEKKHGICSNSIEILPIIESASGLYHAYEVASSSKRVKRLAFGSVDYTLDISAQLTKEGTEILYARSQIVVASRAAGIESPIDTVYIHIKDQEGLLKDANLAKQLGFQGKLVVHPDQVDIVNNVFSPTLEEVKEAKEIIAAFQEATDLGLAAIQVKGKMIDYPVVERAKKVLKQDEASGL